MNKLYQSALLFILSIGFMPVSFAMQEKWVEDNTTAQAFVSVNSLTRIAVENDRIQDVRGPDGAYQIKADVKQGAVFVEPTEAFQHKSFTLFIATEQNRNYVLRLIPRDQNADTILLKTKDAKNPEALRWETSSPYLEAVTQLITTMVNQQSLEGYAVDITIKAKKQRINKILRIQLKQTYTGAYLQGFVYSITNRSSQIISLTENEFYQDGDRAIALSDLTLVPHGQVLLYKVRSHE